MKRWGVLLGFASVAAMAGQAIAQDAPAPGVPAKVGAALPWTTCEAERCATNGAVLGPDYNGRTPQREASGRQCVRLDAAGQYIQFTAQAEAQGLVVRYCLPDSPDGRGINATLSLYINSHFHSKLAMTSRYAYLYGPYPYVNDPKAPAPRHFWDELRLMPGTIHPGDVIRLQRDAGDSASQYLIDLVDLEPVPPPLQQPAGSLSVADFGARADRSADARPAFMSAIAAAKSQGKAVWIPPGHFLINGPIELSDVALLGAGMWYSTLVGADDYSPDHRVAVYGNGSNITLADFAIVGNLNYRNDSEPNDGIGGSFGTGSAIRNIWVEHTKTGAWIVNSDGLVVDGCRFRDTIADGINLCVGMRNTTVRNCSARGGGDDCFAVWPTTYITPVYSPGFNRFIHCTAQLPFLAQGFSIYGGEGNSVQDCEAIDICYGAGLYASTTFPTQFGFKGGTTYRNIRLTRTGDEDGAIGTVANLLDLAGLRFEDITIADSPADGIRFTSMKGHALSETVFDHVRIENTGLRGKGCAIVAAPGAVGSATISNVVVVNAKTAGFKNDGSGFKLIEGTGNVGLADSGPARGSGVAPPLATNNQ